MKILFLISICLNVVIAAFVWSNRKPAPISSTPPPITVKKAKKRNFSHTPAPAPVPAKSTQPKPSHWSQIETNDYPAYIANLRSIGCPEDTISDIVIADIDKHYADLARNVPLAKFWMTHAEQEQLVKERRAESRRLEKEKQNLIRDLLGVEWDSEAHREWVREEEVPLVLGFVSDEKQMKLMSIFRNAEERKRELMEGTFGIKIDSDIGKIQEAAVEMEQAIQNLFSPSEYQEFNLRIGCMFNSTKLVGVELTGAEFRTLMELKTPPNLLSSLLIREESPDSKKGDAQASEEAIKRLLGEKRFADYQRAQDPKFQEVYRETRQFKVPVETVAKVYDLRNLAFEEANRLKADKSLSDQERQMELSKTAGEIRSAVLNVFGPETGQKYLESHGAWLEQMEGNKAKTRKP